MQIVTFPSKKLCISFIFRLFLVSAAAAGLWVAFQWWSRFRH